jgi:hypothetical protein
VRWEFCPYASVGTVSWIGRVRSWPHGTHGRASARCLCAPRQLGGDLDDVRLQCQQGRRKQRRCARPCRQVLGVGITRHRGLTAVDRRSWATQLLGVRGDRTTQRRAQVRKQLAGHDGRLQAMGWSTAAGMRYHGASQPTR